MTESLAIRIVDLESIKLRLCDGCGGSWSKFQRLLLICRDRRVSSNNYVVELSSVPGQRVATDVRHNVGRFINKMSGAAAATANCR